MFDNYSKAVDWNERKVNLMLWDTAGQEDFERLRVVSYTMTDVFIICFKINSKHSFQNTENKWFPELKKFAPDAPIILCGTQGDYRVEGKEDDSVFFTIFFENVFANVWFGILSVNYVLFIFVILNNFVDVE